jgi:uncharacterized membrane protein (DUF106 family)
MSGGGEMDDGLSSTIYNLNQLIDTANNTVNRLAPANDTAVLAQSLSAATNCISKSKWSCDKDKFDDAFNAYVQTLTCSDGTKTQYKNSNNNFCDPVKVFSEVYRAEGERVRDNVDAKIKKMVNELNDLLVVANEQMRYYNHMDDLSDKYDEASKTLEGRVDGAVSRLKTEHRRIFYEQQQSSMVDYITKFLTFFYWVAVFAWIIVIIYRAKYGSYKIIALSAAFIAFPFVADILITWTFQIIMTIYSKLPTDAYLDMTHN